MLFARQLERGMRHNVNATVSLLPIWRLSSVTQTICLLRSSQLEGCACGDSQWTLVLAHIGSLLLEREL